MGLSHVQCIRSRQQLIDNQTHVQIVRVSVLVTTNLDSIVILIIQISTMEFMLISELILSRWVVGEVLVI